MLKLYFIEFDEYAKIEDKIYLPKYIVDSGNH